MGGRMDTIQAAVLNVKMEHYEKDMENRQRVAEEYSRQLSGSVITPRLLDTNTSVWAQYSVRVGNREVIAKRLKEAGIPTAIHYPRPLHLQECFDYLEYVEGDFPIAEKVSNEILSLPMNPYLKDEEIEYISNQLKTAL